MNTSEIKTIAANIMYIDDVNEIESHRSLFGDYAMSSLDFVDFAFELKSESGKSFNPDDLWPVETMMDNPDLFNDGKWTEQGKDQLKKLFAGYATVEDNQFNAEALYNLFSVDYVQHRIAQL